MKKLGRRATAGDTSSGAGAGPERYRSGVPGPPRSTARRLGRIPDAGRSGASAVGVLAGLALCIAVFLPWYATNLGPPFSATSATGWDATNMARIAFVMGLLVTAAAAAAMLDERGMLQLDERHLDALAWVLVGASAIALVAVGYRLLVLPDPAEFLSRQIGLYIAMAAAVAGVLSGLGQVATRA